jgi:hypothetical protein
MATFLDYQHPHVAQMGSAWALAHSMYSGEGVDRYLRQHKMGESNSQFEARRDLAVFQPYLASTLDTVAGMPFDRYDDVERDFGLLGNPEDTQSVAYRFSRSADGRGKDYRVLLQEAALDLLLMQELWCLVDAPEVEGADPTIKLFSPLDVPNYVAGARGAMTEVMVRESVNLAGSIVQEPEVVDQYVVYTPTGWTRFQKQGEKGAEKAVQVASGLWAENERAYVTRSGVPTAPIFRVRLPFRRYVAHQLAKNNASLYNTESDRDNLLRSASFPKLQLVGTDEEVKGIMALLKKGANVLSSNPEHQRDHSYIAPDTNGAEALTDVIEKKVEAFRDNAFRLYEAEARMAVTATEATLNRESGVAPILNVMASALEDLETQALFLLEQTLAPSGYSSDCSWPRDYGTVEAPAAPAEVEA